MSSDSRTYRRRLLDEWLAQQDRYLTGLVIDIGGKRKRKRGNYHPPEAKALKWIYVNIDQSTSPDILADAAAIPLQEATADAIVCTETLEHVPHPAEVVAEMRRLLKPGGAVVGSVPFLYPVHADPYDFQRFTAEGLHKLFKDYSDLAVTAMGGPWGALALQLELMAQRQDGSSRYWRALRWRSAAIVAKFGYALDKRERFTCSRPWPAFTTGYGFIARK